MEPRYLGCYSQIMNETPKTKRGWRIVRRILITLAVLATLVAALYAEEDWRGKRAWEKSKREIEAEGVVLDWNALIPPPVPDDQNFFGAPKMQEWFVKLTDWHHPLTNDLTERLKNPDTVVTITNAAAAEKYLLDPATGRTIVTLEAVASPRLLGDSVIDESARFVAGGRFIAGTAGHRHRSMGGRVRPRLEPRPRWPPHPVPGHRPRAPRGARRSTPPRPPGPRWTRRR